MADDGGQRDGEQFGEASGARVLDVSGLPETVVAAVTLLVEQAARPAERDAGHGADAVSRELLGDVVQAAEVVKGFADACLVDATSGLVADVAADHGVPADDPRFAEKVAVYRKNACRAVVHEVQLLTGCTLTAARDRVRFATAMPERVAGPCVSR
ncbi:hypothetical protein [Flexivirga caeni]|uniref:Uncharacterized protein n=1 Tax=Flexivirga caeni TaxID=2294115 RepID=A0A3M9LWS9_9MICO|nr:hypothetical protein [Flexivirga caeni]RNI17751.1 hypothetical protein EFY87_19325 [Flexivirga caeni]